ncbi:MAG: ribosomal L7Ae/L30e/S12e/Gadd45 family protein [Candidatus Woesearchaeota archaeon]
MADEITEIRNALGKDTLVIGNDRVLKLLKNDKLSKVLLSSNVSEEMETEINTYAKIANVPVVKLDIPNDEIKVMCKKQFLISVLGILK